MTADIGFLAILMVLVQGISLLALKTHVEGAVKHQWDKHLEEFKYEIRQRERAAMIAELIAEWDSRSDDLKRLNQLVLEACLWLPETLARDLNRILKYHPGAKFPKELVVDIRHLLRGEKDGLRADEITHFEHPRA